LSQRVCQQTSLGIHACRKRHADRVDPSLHQQNRAAEKQVTDDELEARTDGKASVKSDAGLSGGIVEVEKIIRPPRILVQVCNTLLGKTNRQAFSSRTVAFMISISAQARYSHDDGSG
jgi:hypothetical protein